MNHFLRNIILVFSPCIIMLAWYIIDDPFMMYWKYDNLYAYGQRKICTNDAYRGIRWMNQFNDSVHYNCFITGSSRSDFYYVDEWKNYLGEDASCFHFNQSGDNLLGTLQRTQYLYKRFDKIDNILFIMDAEFLEDMKPHKGHLFRQPWQVTKEWDFFAYNWECIRAFYTIEYQKQVWGITPKEQMLPFYYIPEYNEVHKVGAEELLDSNPDAYYETLTGFYRLYERTYTDSVSAPVIGAQQRDALEQLHTLLVNGNTDYRIVISPLYNQIALNPQDLICLKEIFGEDKVFDFSGVNEYTNDVSNYYETSHYRPKLCNIILKKIYDTF